MRQSYRILEERNRHLERRVAELELELQKTQAMLSDAGYTIEDDENPALGRYEASHYLGITLDQFRELEESGKIKETVVVCNGYKCTRFLKSDLRTYKASLEGPVHVEDRTMSRMEACHYLRVDMTVFMELEKRGKIAKVKPKVGAISGLQIAQYRSSDLDRVKPLLLKGILDTCLPEQQTRK